MRRAFNSEVNLENGSLVGVNLGADFTSEHEWGIQGIARAFNIKTDKLGIAGRTITECPETLYYQDVKINNKKYWALILSHYPMNYWGEGTKTKYTKEDIGNFELIPYNDDFTLSTAWDESSFGILVKEENKNVLDELYQAFKSLDVAVGISPGHVFKNGGLKFVIVSRLDKETVDGIMENDLDNKRLKEAVEKTGIYKLLEKAGKKYYALSPRWNNDAHTEIIFWLNPMEQNKYNYGWMTIKDLKDWANNKGKIMMQKS